MAAWAASLPYAGSAACAECHRDVYDRQQRSRHANALHPIRESPVAEVLLERGASSGPLVYAARDNGISVTAATGGDEATGLLVWAFGAGAQGITPVGRLGDQFFEHRFSFYRAAGRMSLTFGHPAVAGTARAMLGLPQSSHTITACFQCHATGVDGAANGPDLSAMQPGVQCERCHGPGRRHVEMAKARATAEEVRRAIFNPGRLPAAALVEYCGQCHRLPEPGASSPEPEIENPVAVRFAPVGLLASRCFIRSRRLTCTTCHDPHQDARPATDASYVKACANCHESAPKSGSACRRAAGQNCLPCHMRQASLNANLKFTDHRIR